MEAAVNVVHAQPEKYCMDFDAVVSYLGQMVMKKSLIMPSVQIAKTRSQPVRPKVVTFTGKVECKKYPKAVWNSMTRDQQIQVRKLQEQQGIKPTTWQTGTDPRISALEAKLWIAFQPEQGDVKKRSERLLKKKSGGKAGEILQ